MTEAVYITSFEEVFWGVLLIAVTMAIHGFGVILTLRAAGAMQRRDAGRTSFRTGITTLIVATWIMVVVHLIEVVAWAMFFWLTDGFVNASTAIYYALMQYTTVGSAYNLPERWRLLGGMVAMAGLLTFAWSTSVLFTIAQKFQNQEMTGKPPGRLPRD